MGVAVAMQHLIGRVAARRVVRQLGRRSTQPVVSKAKVRSPQVCETCASYQIIFSTTAGRERSLSRDVDCLAEAYTGLIAGESRWPGPRGDIGGPLCGSGATGPLVLPPPNTKEVIQ
jgi:hypothetical protein